MNTGNATPSESLGNVIKFSSYMGDSDKLSGNISGMQEVSLGTSRLNSGSTILQQKSTAMADITREEVNAKVELSESKSDTKFARLEGKLDLVLSQLSSQIANVSTQLSDVKGQIQESRLVSRDERRSMRSDTILATVSIAILIVAIAALFPVFFDIGTKVKDFVSDEVKSHFAEQKK